MSLLLTGSPRRSERTSYCLLLALTVALLCGSGARAFDLKDVQEKAQALAQKDYDQPAKVPSWLLELNYDQWRNIRFHSDRALWRDRAVPFQVQFFHPGLYYDRTVTINVV
jgi:glucans biosynthesis protein